MIAKTTLGRLIEAIWDRGIKLDAKVQHLWFGYVWYEGEPDHAGRQAREAELATMLAEYAAMIDECKGLLAEEYNRALDLARRYRERP